MTGNPDDAFDLTQDTYVHGFSRMDRFDGRSSISTWLYRIAVNEALQFLRRQGTHRAKLAELAVLKPTEHDHHRPLTTSLDVEAALARIDPNDRAILLLRYQEGLGYRAIAEVAGCPEGTVASRLSRARDRIRAFLKEGYGIGEESNGVLHPIRQEGVL